MGDTHLGFGVGKTMDRFGAEWVDHADKIREHTIATVGADDILLIPGDLSWATKRHQAEPDLAYLAELPGTKIAIKGNHDYWWESDKPIGYPGLLSPPFAIRGDTEAPQPPILGESEGMPGRSVRQSSVMPPRIPSGSPR
ncbi:MAG: metallophosphoesterase, partial [Fibrella sp.]|nr:metallophosphoesterase [Armatimonadota bacterium]